MVKIAQTYIHLRPYDVSRAKARRLGRVADKSAYQSALRIYGPHVQIDVAIAEGSLKTWVTVGVTSIFAVYGAVSNYKGFKEGIGEMCSDARTFGIDVCGKLISSSGASDTQV